MANPVSKDQADRDERLLPELIQFFALFVVTFLVTTACNVITFVFATKKASYGAEFVSSQLKIRRAMMTATMYFASTTLLQGRAQIDLWRMCTVGHLNDSFPFGAECSKPFRLPFSYWDWRARRASERAMQDSKQRNLIGSSVTYVVFPVEKWKSRKFDKLFHKFAIFQPWYSSDAILWCAWNVLHEQMECLYPWPLLCMGLLYCPFPGNLHSSDLHFEVMDSCLHKLWAWVFKTWRKTIKKYCLSFSNLVKKRISFGFVKIFRKRCTQRYDDIQYSMFHVSFSHIVAELRPFRTKPFLSSKSKAMNDWQVSWKDSPQKIKADHCLQERCQLALQHPQVQGFELGKLIVPNQSSDYRRSFMNGKRWR